MECTIKNLSKAFIGESQARNRYTFYAKTAKKEGYEQISEIFLQTADNEREHAKCLFQLLNDLNKKYKKKTTIEIETFVPTSLGDTEENIKAAIEGENYEYTKMYPQFAEAAKKEQLPKIAKKLMSIAIAEKHHEERYKNLLKELKKKAIFKKDKKVYWVCRECGYVHLGKEPPKKCPSCDHPKNYFEIKCEEY